jgi:hypothetical protein
MPRHFIGVARNYDLMGAEAESVILLARRRGEHDDMGTERPGKLHAHVTQPADPHDADLFA